MFEKLGVVVFLTIFCNGVAYSSPTKAKSLDLISTEQAAATEVVSHINHKIEPNNTAPDAGVHHIENPQVNISANHSITEDKAGSNSTRIEKITNQDSSANDTKTATDATVKSPNANFSGPAGNSPAGSGSMPTAPTSTAVPVAHVNITTDLPPRNWPDMTRPPIVAGQSTTTVTTPAAGTTTKAPVTTPTVATPTPAHAVSTTTDNVVLVHNSSTKAQENRFDGASFVGGIVLTIGLTAIGFIAFKYYKSGYY